MKITDQPDNVRLYLYDNYPEYAPKDFLAWQINRARERFNLDPLYKTTYELYIATAQMRQGLAAITIDGHTFKAESVEFRQTQESKDRNLDSFNLPRKLFGTEYEVAFRLAPRDGIVYNIQGIS